MIYQLCGENEKLFTKIFRINGVDYNNNYWYSKIVDASFSDALNGTVYFHPHAINGTQGPLLSRKAIIRSTLITFYGHTSQKIENPTQYITIPLQARVVGTSIYDLSGIGIEISGPKIEDETTLTAKREQLVDFDLVVFYTLLEY